MNSSAFHDVTAALGSLGRKVAALPLDAYLEDLGRDAAFGCFMDAPQVWASRRAICEALTKLAEAGRAFAAASEATDAVAMKNILDEGARRLAQTPE